VSGTFLRLFSFYIPAQNLFQKDFRRYWEVCLNQLPLHSQNGKCRTIKPEGFDELSRTISEYAFEAQFTPNYRNDP
jgi:hypothetical protein